jgi:hypothetical protein
MTVLTLAVGEDAPGRLRTAAATFPRSFRTSGPATPDVHIIGGDAGWTARATSLIQAGAHAVLVADPVAEEVHGLLVSARESRASVLLAPAGAADPAFEPLRERLTASDGRLLECRVIASPAMPRSATVIAMLTIVASADSPVSELDSMAAGAHGLHAAGRLESGRDVVLALDLSEAVHPVARLRAISSLGAVEADIPLSERSRPAVVRDISDGGEWHSAVAYLTASRATLARLHAVATGSPDLRDLDAFEAQLPFARELTWP